MTVLFFFTFLILMFIAWLIVYKSKEKERKMLIEKGVDYNELPNHSFQFKFKFPWLKIGLVISGAALGLLVALALTLSEFVGFGRGQIHQEGLAISLVFLFGGIGMIVAYYLERSKENDE